MRQDDTAKTTSVQRETRQRRRQRQVVARGDDVKHAALIMRRDRHMTGEAVSSQCVGELPGSRVVRSIQTDADVADDEDRVVERGDPVEHIRQLGEEGRRHRTSPVDDDGDAGRRRRRHAHTQQLARLALDTDVEPPQTDAKHSDYSDAAVVIEQVVTHTWTRSIHHLKSVCT